MNKKLCIISSPVSTRSGYGAHSRDIIRSLIKTKGVEWDIKLLSQKWGDCPLNALIADKDDDLVSRLLFEDIKQQPDIWIQISVPNEFQKVGKYNIGITAGIETDICSHEWIEGCNRMDKIIVPSEHAKTVFKETQYKKFDNQTKKEVGILKIDVPIDVVFEGIDLSVYNKTAPIEQSVKDIMKSVPEDFCFLFVGHWIKGSIGNDRKDIFMMLKVFLETFRNDKNPPAIILKTSGATFSVMDKYDILAKIEQVKHLVPGKIPNIYLVHGDLSDEEMNSLYNHPKIKAHLSFTHGEGFGRPLLEATMSGKPVIAPDWSGQIDFLHDEFAFKLPGELKQIDETAVWDKVILKESKWFVVDYNMAANVLKHVHSDYNSYLTRSRKHIKYTKDNFSLSKMDEILLKSIENIIVNKDPVVLPLNLPVLKKKSSSKIELPQLKNLK